MRSVNSTLTDGKSLGIHQGFVTNFDDAKGYGFIQSPAANKYVYVHFTAISSRDKRRSLNVGQKVEFELRMGDKGPYASSVRVVMP